MNSLILTKIGNLLTQFYEFFESRMVFDRRGVSEELVAINELTNLLDYITSFSGDEKYSSKAKNVEVIKRLIAEMARLSLGNLKPKTLHQIFTKFTAIGFSNKRTG